MLSNLRENERQRLWNAGVQKQPDTMERTLDEETLFLTSSCVAVCWSVHLFVTVFPNPQRKGLDHLLPNAKDLKLRGLFPVTI